MNKLIKYKGVVEGFFSRPLSIWTTKERIKTITFIKKFTPQLNSYFYCPKQDIYVTSKWNVLYPAKKINDLKKVIKTCGNKIEFIYGLNPEINFTKYSASTWIKLVKQKISQLQKIGCKRFCILFDDLPIAYDVLMDDLNHQKTFHKIIKLINDLYCEIKNDVEHLFICPPDYCFKKETYITKSLQALNKNIDILWSGNDIFVKTITIKDLDRVKKLLGKDKKLIIWFNYPVNDCQQNLGMYNLGGMPFIKEKVISQTEGIFINPMREAFTNLPFYLTFNDFSKNISTYNEELSWQKALQQLFGTKSIQFSKIYKEFSQLDVIDSKNKKGKWFSSIITKSLSLKDLKKLLLEVKNLIKEIKNYEAKNPWGKSFREGVKEIEQSVVFFVEVVQKILQGNVINMGEFNKKDLFPTITHIDRYLPEIEQITTTRVLLVKKDSQEKRFYYDLVDKSKVFQKKYKGREWLFLSKKESSNILRLITDIITQEKLVFVNFINDKSIDPVKRVVLFIKRQNVNRFSLGMFN